tara:strand:- start:1532 stop:1804 length:273 start_codon:yes stop_codon:yes gene_type:complete
MAYQGGLRKWFREDWVDIGSKKKKGKHQKCGRKSAKGSKRKYPKCVPAAKARTMSASQKRSAVKRKRARAQGVGGKPTNVRTFARSRRKK